MYLKNYKLWKTLLKNSLESAVSEFPSTMKMVLGGKHFWNPHENTFIIFLDHSE